MSEEWRPVPDWPLYAVSDFGRIKRIRGPGRREDRLLKLRPSPKGYGKVSLSGRRRQSKNFLAHRLVAMAFLGPPPSPRHEVAHADGVASNGRLDNLSWKLPKENAAMKWLHGTQPTKHSSEKVAAARCLLANGFSRKAVGRVLGMSDHTAGAIVNGRSRVHR